MNKKLSFAIWFVLMIIALVGVVYLSDVDLNAQQ